MKKLFTLFILISGLSISAFGQKGLHFGVQYTYNYVSVVDPYPQFDKKIGVDSTSYDYKSKFGGSPGLVLGYNFTNTIGIQAELNFAALGYLSGRVSGSETIVRDVDLAYSLIPVMAKFSTPGKSRLYFLIGPQFAYLTKANVHLEHNSQKEDIDGMANNYFSTNDLQITLGLGGDFNLTKRLYLNFGFRANYGFSDVNSESHQVFLPPGNVLQKSQNAFGGLTLGLHYAFGKMDND